MRSYLILIFALGWEVASYAQSAQRDSVLNLRLVDIIDNRRPSSNPGLNAISLDSNTNPAGNGYSMGDVLSRYTNMFIRINSPGLLASPSSRGTDPSHTALVWKGFNLQSSMNGQSDLNLIQSMFFNNSSYLPGTNSAAYGSGATGGTLFLDEKTVENMIEFSQISGSWNDRKIFLDVGHNNNRFSYSLKAFRHKADNDFRFRNHALPGSPMQRQENAGQEMGGILHSLELKTGSNHALQISQWWQEGNRQLPPTVLVPESKASQFDNVFRTVLDWKWKNRMYDLCVRTAAFREKINYEDSLSSIYARNSAITFNQEIESGIHLRSHDRLQIGLNNSHTRASVDEYKSGLGFQNRQAIFTSFHHTSPGHRMRLLFALRQEWFNGKTSPLIPSFSMNMVISDHVSIKGQVSRIFRIPTMNDLFWIPGGNNQLKPEGGVSSEISFPLNWQIRNFSLKICPVFFASSITNRILWLPGNAFWSPVNVGRFNSLGHEFSIRTNFDFKKFFLRMNASVQFLKSGETLSLFKFAQFQQIFIPQLTGNQSVEMGNHRVSVFYSSSWCGPRYTSADNSSFLPAFYLANAGVSFKTRVSKHRLVCSFQINNIFNTDYSVMAWRPMPLASWQASLTYRIPYQNSKTP